jgi:hypothetical protein
MSQQFFVALLQAHEPLDPFRRRHRAQSDLPAAGPVLLYSASAVADARVEAQAALRRLASRWGNREN